MLYRELWSPRGRGRKKGEGRGGGKATRRVGSERGRKTRRGRLGKASGEPVSCLVAKLDSFGKRSVKAAWEDGRDTTTSLSAPFPTTFLGLSSPVVCL